MKKEIKKPGAAAFTAREVGTLIEDLRSQFMVFGEDLSSVKGKLDALFEGLGKQKEDLFVIGTDVRIMKKGISEIKDGINGHDGRLSRLEASLK